MRTKMRETPHNNRRLRPCLQRIKSHSNIIIVLTIDDHLQRVDARGDTGSVVNHKEENRQRQTMIEKPTARSSEGWLKIETRQEF